MTSDERRTVYFGEPWDAPVLDHAVRIAAPIGLRCLYCTEMIWGDDQGLMQGAEPAHRECLMRAVLGGMDHFEGRCSCYGGDADHAPVEPSTWRAEGRAILAWLEGHRGT